MQFRYYSGHAKRPVDVVDGWDDIGPVGDRWAGGRRSPCQRGKPKALRKPADLIGGAFEGLKQLPAGGTLFTGTISAIGEIIGGDQFAVVLVDTRRCRNLRHGYDVEVLPVAA